jgi:DNA-binding transcriptional regulator LsrR (DeoR family)
MIETGNSPSDATLVQVAQLYYIENRSQQEIADALSVSRSLIALYLKKARERGIVNIEIRNPQDTSVILSQMLSMRTGIKRATVVPTLKNGALTRRTVAAEIARFLEDNLNDRDVLGLGFGRTMDELPSLLAPNRPRRIMVVPLVGESASNYSNSYSQINQIVMQTAQAFEGTPYFLLAPLLVGSQSLCSLLNEDEHVRSVTQFWDHLTYAVIGIGTVPPVEGEVVYVGEPNLAKFTRAGAIGDTCTRYFDENGNYIQTDLHGRTIGITFDQLRLAKHVVVFASGAGKVRAVLAFLKTGMVTHLFVDEELAKSILMALPDPG